MKKISKLSFYGILLTIIFTIIVVLVFFKKVEIGGNEPLNILQVVLTGKIYHTMTYGRLLIENYDKNAEYKYFIIEPNDVIEEGALRYSSTTRGIKDTDIVRVSGIIAHEEYKCWWNEPEYGGCVPWVKIESLEIIE